MKTPISVVIISRNEEAHIEECIKSVHGWAGEIIIIDDDSQDNTVAIAEKYTDKVYRRKMDLEGRQRNFGISKTAFDWVMMLDCDERLTPELKHEITEVLHKGENGVALYSAPKIDYLGKHQLRYGGWSSPQAKLGNKKYVRFSEAEYDVVHVGVIIEKGSTIRTLKSPYIHYNYANIEDLISKVNRYSTLTAIKWHLDGRKMGLGKALWRTIDRFLRMYLRKKGYKDGFYGFIAALTSGAYEIITYAKYREIREYNMYSGAHGTADPADR